MRGWSWRRFEPGGDEVRPVTSKVMLDARWARVASRRGEGSGFEPSDNLPRRWTGEPHQGVVVLVEPERRVEIDGLDGMRVVVLNATAEEAAFDAQDSRLDLVQEAFDPDLGLWRAIESRLGPGTCGNSYHTVVLQPGECWELSAPRYAGPIATKLRAALTVKGARLRSAPFDGGVHEGQFVPTRVEPPRIEPGPPREGRGELGGARVTVEVTAGVYNLRFDPDVLAVVLAGPPNLFPALDVGLSLAHERASPGAVRIRRLEALGAEACVAAAAALAVWDAVELEVSTALRAALEAVVLATPPGELPVFGALPN